MKRTYESPAITATAEYYGYDCSALKLTLDPLDLAYLDWLRAWTWAMQYLDTVGVGPCNDPGGHTASQCCYCGTVAGTIDAEQRSL